MKKSQNRRRGRPALVRVGEPQSFHSSHATPELKAMLMNEAHACGVSLSLYLAVVLASMPPKDRLAAGSAERVKALQEEGAPEAEVAKKLGGVDLVALVKSLRIGQPQ